MGLLRKFQPVLLGSSLLTLYEIFIRRQVDFADIIYDPIYNFSFHEETVVRQYLLQQKSLRQKNYIES